MPLDENNIYYSVYPSWYEIKEPLTEEESFYLYSLEKIWRVPSGTELIPYHLAPHQIDWHREDIALKGRKAKYRACKKSRNTSYTVSMSISKLMAVPEHKNPSVPFVRLNSRSSILLIENIKQLIRDMSPIIYTERYMILNGVKTRYIDSEEYKDLEVIEEKHYYPFNPEAVDLRVYGKIRFPNGVVFEAYPANNNAAENARGIRTLVDGGGIDEPTFFSTFREIFVAMRDAYASSVFMEEEEGGMLHQIDIGSSFRGVTPYSEWYDEQVKIWETNPENALVKLYEWPVFRRDLFDEYEKASDTSSMVPFTERRDMIPIVPWHSKKLLWDKYLQDKVKFMEEYMAIQVDSDYQFYPTKLIVERSSIEPNDNIYNIDFNKYHKVRGGIDPASVKDYFVFSLFGHYGNKREKIFCWYGTQVELPDMEVKCKEWVGHIVSKHKDVLINIDSTPIGLQLMQGLRKMFGEVIRPINGNNNVKTLMKNSYKLNVYGHLNLRKLMYDKVIDLFADEVQIKHYKIISGKDYQPIRDGGLKDSAHGDICMGDMYANLPDNLIRADEIDGSIITEDSILESKKELKKIEEEYDESFGDKLARMSKNREGSGRLRSTSSF